MKAKLVVVGGETKTSEVNLKLPTVIGRGREATLALPHPLVSRKHCEIYEADGQLHVRDLGSLNGTFVGNERITDAPLPPGELLTIGAVTFRAMYDVSSQEDTARAAGSRSAPDDTVYESLPVDESDAGESTIDPSDSPAPSSDGTKGTDEFHRGSEAPRSESPAEQDETLPVPPSPAPRNSNTERDQSSEDDDEDLQSFLQDRR